MHDEVHVINSTTKSLTGRARKEWDPHVTDWMDTGLAAPFLLIFSVNTWRMGTCGEWNFSVWAVEDPICQWGRQCLYSSQSEIPLFLASAQLSLPLLAGKARRRRRQLHPGNPYASFSMHSNLAVSFSLGFVILMPPIS